RCRSTGSPTTSPRCSTTSASSEPTCGATASARSRRRASGSGTRRRCAGPLAARGVGVRPPSKGRRLVLAAVNIRPDGYHPEITAPEQDDPRLPTEQEFAAWQAAYEAAAPDPDNFFPFLERLQPVVHDWRGWTDDEIR